MSDFKIQLKEDLARIRKGIERDARAAEKAIGPAEDKLAGLEIKYQEECDRVLNLIDDFLETELRILNEEKDSILKNRVLIDDFKKGKISADEYREKGISEDELGVKMRKKSYLELDPLHDAIREKQTEIRKIQLALEMQKSTLVYLLSQPVSLEIAYLKSKITELESEQTSVMFDSPAITGRIKELKQWISQIDAGELIYGKSWYNVTPDLIAKDLRFDPLIPKYLQDELMSIRREMLDAGIEVLTSPLTLRAKRTTAPGEGQAGFHYSLPRERKSIHTGDRA